MLVGMNSLLSIGEFSRATHLSVKALHHYHEVGLLEPAEIDPMTSYRRYDAAQVHDAQLVRRLRALDMPLADVKVVLGAPDAATRQRTILAHLERMERELERTRDIVASLRALLEDVVAPAAVGYRSVEAVVAFARRATVARADVAAWCAQAYPELYAAVAATGLDPAGPGGALYSGAFFEDDAGEVVAFVPVPPGARPAGRVTSFTVPAADLAVTVHHGPYVDIDLTYGALGSHVAEHALGAAGPIREHYLVGPADVDDPERFRTEVCWPITQREGALR
jgi:DNA-binding transcriptional MerR regulator/effector-binding domain-containing protein